MNVELVAQMFKNYQSNVLFHLEGKHGIRRFCMLMLIFVDSYGQLEAPELSTCMRVCDWSSSVFF
jgi:hypothetical protein